MSRIITAVVALGMAAAFAVPAMARNHGTTPGLQGPASGQASVPAASTKSSPGVNNPTTAPVSPISDPGGKAPGQTGTAPGHGGTSPDP